jgi:hypothetical protein
MAWDGAAAWHRRPSASFDRLSFDFAQDSRLRMRLLFVLNQFVAS